MPAKRCSLCAENWPLTEAFDKCPQCGEKTDRIRNVEAMNEDEALSIKKHCEFEAFYEKWDASQPPERLIPAQAEDEQEGTAVGTITKPEKPQ